MRQNSGSYPKLRRGSVKGYHPQNSEVSVRQAVGAGVMGLALLSLGGCGMFSGVAQALDESPNVGPCPVAGVLYDASRMVELNGAERHENVGFTGSIEGIHGFCRYTGTNPITMELDIDFAFGRGPQAASDEKTYTYFISVSRRDRIVLAKENFAVSVKFAKGQTVVHRRERVDGIVIPRATETVSGSNFEVLAGFELTPDQLAFNRAGKRFRMTVSGAAGGN